jgi:hypothetical protein
VVPENTRPDRQLIRCSALRPTYGKRVVGLLLTGAGQDGLDGMIAISQSAGWNLVQHPEKAYMPSMPLAALHGDHAEPTACGFTCGPDDSGWWGLSRSEKCERKGRKEL